MSWLPAYRRPAVRYDRRATTMLGLPHLARSLTCPRFLKHVEG